MLSYYERLKYGYITYFYFVGKDACQGDSGGPLFAMRHKNNTRYGLRQYEIVGITSFGKDCGLNGFPGINLMFITDNAICTY